MGGRRLIPVWVMAAALMAAGQALCCPYGTASTSLTKNDAATHPGLKPAKPTVVRTGDEPGDPGPANADVNAPATRPVTSHLSSYGTAHESLEGTARSQTRTQGADKASLGIRAGTSRERNVQDNGGQVSLMSAPTMAQVGLKVRPLNDTERRDFGVPEGGLVVTGVRGESAQHAGFRLGDVVLSLDGVAVTDPGQFHQLILQLPHDRPVPVLVRRPNSNLFLPLDAPHR